MKLKTRILILLSSLGLVTLMPSCESAGGPSDTHEMGGPGKSRMDNSLMPNRGETGTGSSTGSGSNTHEMGGPGKARMDNSIMPDRN
jgi:hypothetical protein